MIESKLVLCLIGFVWVVCGLLQYGIVLAFYQKEFPSDAQSRAREDQIFAFFMSLFGPLSLIAALLKGMYRHGMQLGPTKDTDA